MKMVRVLKFGGTSVANAECLRQVTALVAREVESQEYFPVVVVSAMAGVTDLLFELAALAARGQPYSRGLVQLRQRHLIAAEQSVLASVTCPPLLDELAAAFGSLEQELARVADTGEWGVAAVAAWGERLSALLLAATLRAVGVPAERVREEVVVTNAPAHFRASQGAEPLIRETGKQVRAALAPLLARAIVPVVPGYIARSVQGDQTLLGRGGSDWTATLVASALDRCAEVCIYTDVEGVFSADPRIVGEARRLPMLSYEEAALLAGSGAKVLHPQTLSPIIGRGIPVWVKNTFDPDAPGTVIGPYSSLGAELGAFALRSHLALVTVRGEEPYGPVGQVAAVFSILAGAGISPFTWRASHGGQLAFVVEESLAEQSAALLREGLGGIELTCRKGVAACTFLGGDLLADLIRAGCALTSLAAEGIRIEAASLTQHCLTLLVGEEDAPRTLRELHAALIPLAGNVAAAYA
jgi:aspartate kinase